MQNVIYFVPMSELPNRVREHRKARGWTQAELADRSGISEPYLSSLERGTRRMNADTMVQLAHALGVSSADLLHQAQNPDALTREERDIIERYRAASDEGRATFRRVSEAVMPYRAQPRDEDEESRHAA